MKIDKIRELDTAEIATKLRDSEEQLFRLRFQLSMGQTDGLKKLRELRKDRARMLTLLGERGVSRYEVAPAAPTAKRGGKAATKKAK